MKSTISIIVVAYNETKQLRTLKESVDRQVMSQHWRMETVLVDNGSSDGTTEVAVRMGFDKVIDCEGTIAACRNAGYRVAAGEIIAYVDADCELCDAWAGHVIAMIRDGSGLVGWPVEPPVPMTWVQEAWHAHWTNKRGHVDRMLSGEPAMTLITTANMSMTREVMERVGGFDESLRSGEDMNFLLRAFREGVELIASPYLKVIHHGEPRTLKAFYRQQKWHCSKSSFLRILRSGSWRKGGNALLFTVANLFSLIFLLFGIVLTAVFGVFWYILLVFPYFLLVMIPATVICVRSRSFRCYFSLILLYMTYGWVRVVDLLGLGVRSKSWRSDSGHKKHKKAQKNNLG